MTTVLDVIQKSTPYLAKSGVESARLNIEHLLAHVLGKKRMDLYIEFDRPLADQELEPLRALVKRRAAGEPLQHLLGTVEFYGRTFLSDQRALIPRPETEQLVEMILETPLTPPEAKIADVGTGTGVIALSLAGAWTQAEVCALDLSPEALALARANAEKLELAGRVAFLQSDLLAAAEGPFAVIVANLPYIAAGVIPSLAREVQFDPQLALDGGPAGTEIISRLLAEAPAKLAPGGRLALEIGHDQADYFVAELERRDYKNISARPDYQGVRRFLFATYG